MQDWYTLDIQEIFTKLETSRHGLSDKAVAERVKAHGKNTLPVVPPDSIFKIFINQFKSPIIYILLFAALVVFFMGDRVDSAIIFLVLLINATVGAFQEGKAQNTLHALANFVKTEAMVIRDGIEKIIADTDIVVGDIVFLKEGDKVPADGRIFEVQSLKVDESALTGEANSVEKNENIISEKDIPASSQKNMVFRGTYVTSGHSHMVVTSVGIKTEIGKISKALEKINTDIPLKKNIKDLSRIIIIVVLLLSFFVFILGVARGIPVQEMFKTAVAIAVSVIPEGLPIVVTLILARGVLRMSKRNALVRKLQAVESLGQAKIIAVDKTGTITMNQMMVSKIYTGGFMYDVNGEGYNPKGEILNKNEPVEILNHTNLLLIGKISAFTSTAGIALNQKTKTYERVYGDPTEVSLLALSQKIGFHKDELLRENPMIIEFPFDFKNKYHASVNKVDGKEQFFVAGAPEAILPFCDKIFQGDKTIENDKERKDGIEKAMKEMSSLGLRVLVLAYNPDIKNKIEDGILPKLVFVSVLGIADTLRPEVKDSVAYAEKSGVKIVMITGDHVDTAVAIARQAGIFKDGDIVISGVDLHKMSAQELAEKLPKTSVFARVTPEDKLKIISAYRANGDVVAMTGDGVNDALSLAAADLGIAMGRTGTEVAKEASDIILLDDNFKSIVSAIAEGRSIYATIKKVVLYLFSTGIGEMFVLIMAISLSLPLPVSATQIIWLNFVTDGFLVIALALGPRDNSDNHKVSHTKILNKSMVARMILQGMVMMIGTIILFKIYLPLGYLKATSIALTVLAVFQWFNVYNCQSDKLPVIKKFKINKSINIAILIVVGLQLIVLYIPFFQNILKTTSISLYDWAIIIGIASSVFIIDLIWKIFHNFSLYKRA